MLNSAFELQEDKELREDNLFQPFKLASLWDMLPFLPEELIQQIYTLAGLRLTPSRPGEEAARDSIRPVMEQFLSELSQLHRTLTNLELIASAASVEICKLECQSRMAKAS
jgi:hypothetical protein